MKLLVIALGLTLISCGEKKPAEQEMNPFTLAAAKKSEKNPFKSKTFADQLSLKAAKLNKERADKKNDPYKTDSDKDLLGLPKSEVMSTLGKGLVYKPKTEGLGVRSIKETKVEKLSPPPPSQGGLKKNYRLASYEPKKEPKKVTKPKPPRKSYRKKPKKKRMDMEALVLASSGNRADVVVGRSPGYVGKESNLLKLGSQFLAHIEDAEVISRGMKAVVVVNVVGVLSDFATTRPYKLFAEMSLNPNETRVDVKVVKCIGIGHNALSLPCKGVIKGIDGKTGLTGAIYNPVMWGRILEVGTKAVAGWTLERMTRTVTNNGVLTDQTRSNAVLSGLASGIQAFGEDQAAEWAKVGATITLPGNAVVKVLITEDKELWSDSRDMSLEPMYAMNGSVARF